MLLLRVKSPSHHFRYFLRTKRLFSRQHEDDDPRYGPSSTSASSSRLGMLASDFADFVGREGIPDSASDMSAWEAVANRKIRQGMRQGEFDGLAGSGKPLQEIGWSDRAISEHALGEKILRNANAKPRWAQVKFHTTIATLIHSSAFFLSFFLSFFFWVNLRASHTSSPSRCENQSMNG